MTDRNALRRLARDLDRLFSPEKPKRPSMTTYRRKAQTLASRIGVTVEYDREMHVYLVIPPEHIENTDADRFNGDHCAADWKEALWMVEEYAKTLPAIAG